ncbi:hypothetical protein [Nonomuraea sp. NPDC048901]|uniref:hypothetical protein n=1 Tax=Nonomuraea sp. NPDC048901 TaxID=3155627 RepID=UPI0034008288
MSPLDDSTGEAAAAIGDIATWGLARENDLDIVFDLMADRIHKCVGFVPGRESVLDSYVGFDILNRLRVTAPGHRDSAKAWTIKPATHVACPLRRS